MLWHRLLPDGWLLGQNGERKEGKEFFLFDFIVLQKMVFTSILKSFSTLTKTSRHIKGYATA
jgi:hypothetical protein